MAREHAYALTVRWTGNRGEGTRTYRAYGRDHAIEAPGKATIDGSSDPAFRGDAARWNPEELLVAALSACHMLWFLDLARRERLSVTSYEDRAEGEMDGTRFTRVALRPRIEFEARPDEDKLARLHEGAHERCFIASFVGCPVVVE